MAHTHVVRGKYFGLAAGLTAAFVVAELTAGLIGNSLALIADAGHNFADALALVFSWYAFRMASRPADAERTFGYHRVGILAALFNAAALVAMALFLFYEAVQRLIRPEPVQSGLMIGVAAAAVVLNGLITFWMHGDARHDLNVRSAYLHMLGDALSALAVVGAGVAVALTGASVADPIVSLVIGVLIVWSSWDVLLEAVTILLEAVPRGLSMSALADAIENVPGVLNVHDLHVWTLASGIVACSCHILVAEQSVRSGQQILRAVVHELEHHFGITHTTIQVEVEGCEPNDMYCTLRRAEAHDHSH